LSPSGVNDAVFVHNLLLLAELTLPLGNQFAQAAVDVGAQAALLRQLLLRRAF
jgi:hypothetical protein